MLHPKVAGISYLVLDPSGSGKSLSLKPGSVYRWIMLYNGFLLRPKISCSMKCRADRIDVLLYCSFVLLMTQNGLHLCTGALRPRIVLLIYSESLEAMQQDVAQRRSTVLPSSLEMEAFTATPMRPACGDIHQVN